jgi:hypothetical protein
MDGCQFEKRRFQVNAGSPGISEEDWRKAFRSPEQREKEEQEKDEGGRREESCPESTDEPQTEE